MLLREAARRNAADARVRLFTSHLRFPKRHLLDDLRSFEERPDLDGGDAEMRASWYASSAAIWAQMRDLQRAYGCLDRALALAPDDAWVLSSESLVHGLAHRWADALKSAELAWASDPGSPFAAVTLGTALLSLGCVEESAARLYEVARESQSWELVLDACWRQCALAETRESGERESALDRATRLADRLPLLTPLADRESRAMVARARLDIATLSEDYIQIERWADEVRSPFHRKVVASLRTNTAGRRIRLPFHRTIQKHDTCLPASLSAAMSAGGFTLDVDDIAAEITFGGTPEWAAAAWLRERAFHVRTFAVTSELAIRLIHHQIAFVLFWDAEEGGHAVAVVGFDERAETLLVHDPQSFRTTEYLLTVLDQRSSPLGFRGMAVVRQDRSADLDALLPPDSAVVEAAQEYGRVLAAHGPSATAPIVADVVERFPSHPGGRYLQAVRLLDAGQTGQAQQELLELLQAYPDAPAVRVRALAACRAVGNLAGLRQVLADIVERGVLPGFAAGQEWLRPPERYVFEYADLLRLSAATRDQAEAMLHALLRRRPTSAGAWHVLADLLSQKPDPDAALLCHRLAACLAGSDEHYAQAYAAALAARKREGEGLQWLESRARALGSPRHAVGTWLSWISALENQGYPERAIAACQEAIERHGRSAELLAFAVAFFARMGLWEMAEAQLPALTRAENPAAFHEASTRLSRMRGDVRAAIEHCQGWINELPHSMDARRTMLQLIAVLDGPGAAVRTAALWLQANRNHEGFEGVYCEQVDRAGGPAWKKCSLLRRRLTRNPDDAWAWRELTFEHLLACEAAAGSRRRRVERRIEHFLGECDRTSSEDVSTGRARARWAELRGDWADAVAGSVRCIDREPGDLYSHHLALRCSARMTHDERLRVWAEIRPLLLKAPGRLSVARPMIALLAERFGVTWTEQEVARWRDERPDDPDLLEAAVDLSDRPRPRGVRRPAGAGPAGACGRAVSVPCGPALFAGGCPSPRGDGAESEEVLHEIVRRHPDNWAARIQLALDQAGGWRSGRCPSEPGPRARFRTSQPPYLGCTSAPAHRTAATEGRSRVHRAGADPDARRVGLAASGSHAPHGVPRPRRGRCGRPRGRCQVSSRGTRVAPPRTDAGLDAQVRGRGRGRVVPSPESGAQRRPLRQRRSSVVRADRPGVLRRSRSGLERDRTQNAGPVTRPWSAGVDQAPPRRVRSRGS